LDPEADGSTLDARWWLLVFDVKTPELEA
jgi:hypothetical protein